MFWTVNDLLRVVKKGNTAGSEKESLDSNDNTVESVELVSYPS
jgi:hypothetical protein